MQAQDGSTETTHANGPETGAPMPMASSADATSHDSAPLEPTHQNPAKARAMDVGDTEPDALTRAHARLVEAQARIAEAQERIAALGAEVEREALARRLRDAVEDAGALRVRDALRAAHEAMARSPAATASAIPGVIEAVRAAHPEYFADTRWASTNAPATGAPGIDAPRADVVDRLASLARATNDRRALLEYLRARRAK